MNKSRGWLDHRVIATVLTIKILILLFGLQAYIVLSNHWLTGPHEFLGIWHRWDAINYIKISEIGYVGHGEDRFLIVFFPLYPLLVAGLKLIVRDSLLSAFLITGLASLALGLVFRQLVRLDHPERTAQAAVFFMFIFPTSFFLHIPYTESLFLALTIGSFLAARKRSWLVVGILGGLACITRINGVFIFPALLFEIWQEYRETKDINLGWFSLCFLPVGFLLYLTLNYVVAGDPFRFMDYQSQHWYRHFRFPWYGIRDAVGRFFYEQPDRAIMYSVQELIFVVIGLAAIIAGWRHLRHSYRFWMVANWLLFISTSFVLSVPRYTLILFPLFILMALASVRSRWANMIMTVWSLMFLAFFIGQFVREQWAF
ncbi:MAG: hypothetical protein R2747_23395 [Pyrinomonadaceae bacterium]